MLSVSLLEPGGKLLVGGVELLDSAGSKWIEVQAPSEAEMRGLAERYCLHRLEVEDCLHLDQRPKLEEYPGHVFIVLQGFTGPPGQFRELTLHEMHFFVGPDWLITVHEQGNEAVDEIRKRVQADPAATLGRGPDFLAYLLADRLVDRHFPIMDAFNDLLEEIEVEIFERAVQAHMVRVFEMKRVLVQLRRVLSPQRDVVGQLSRRGLPHIQDRTTLYFRDVYDHLARLYEQIDASRDLVGNALDAYLSVVANRTGDISKQLTIFATLFLPLTFVTGFFGMNFEVLSRPPFFWLMLALTATFPPGLIVWFRRKKWIG